jgi:hypothetical protein
MEEVKYKEVVGQAFTEHKVKLLVDTWLQITQR